MAPEIQTKYNWKEARRKVVRTLIKILTTTRAVIEFERRPGGGNLFILLTLSFSLISTFKNICFFKFQAAFLPLCCSSVAVLRMVCFASI